MVDLVTSVKNNVRTIRFNKPQKKNAISLEAYEEITRILNSDSKDDNIVVTIFTGVGDYFSSGNDFTGLMEKLADMDMETMVNESSKKFKAMIEAFLNYPKLLICVVNGPAIGIGVTMCALCDIVYASDTATFKTPFVSLGLCAEGCSSYLLNRILGKSKASEMLLLGHKMDAEEAKRFNFISEIIPKHEIDIFIEKLHDYGSIPVKSLILNKKLVTAATKNALFECNDRECAQLVKCQLSEEFSNNIIAFITRKNKL